MAGLRKVCSPVLLALLVVAAAAVVPAVAGAADRCVECHLQSADEPIRVPAELVPRSAHRHPAIGCVGCHGGDPDDPTARAHAPDAGFTGKPTVDRIPSLCGGCHGDARFIRRFNAELRIDQQVLFGASRHGELAAAADGAAPVCTTCHGHHDVLAAANPRAPVHPTRVAELCGSCHSDESRMSGFQIPTHQVAQWQRSAHAEAVRQGTPRAPSCTGCHGSHSEMPAEVTSVARACATCHAEQLDHFERSPHAEPFRKQGFAECVPCHGTHDVPAAQPLEIAFGPDGSCSRCHAADDETNETIRSLVTLLRNADDQARRARKRMDSARLSGLHVAEAASALAELQTAQVELAPVVHRFDATALEPALEEVTKAARRVDELMAVAERERKVERASALAGIGLLGMLFLLLVLKAVRLSRRRRA